MLSVGAVSKCRTTVTSLSDGNAQFKCLTGSGSVSGSGPPQCSVPGVPYALLVLHYLVPGVPYALFLPGARCLIVISCTFSILLSFPLPLALPGARWTKNTFVFLPGATRTGVPSYALLVFYGMLSDMSMALPVVFAFAALGSTGVYGEDEVDYAQYRHWIGLGRRMEVFFLGVLEGCKERKVWFKKKVKFFKKNVTFFKKNVTFFTENVTLFKKNVTFF